MTETVLGYPTNELLAIPPEDVALELAKIEFASANMPMRGLSSLEAAYNMVHTLGAKHLTNKPIDLTYFFGITLEDSVKGFGSSFWDAMAVPVDCDVTKGYGAFLKRPAKDRDELHQVGRHIFELGELLGLFGVGFIDAERHASAAHVAARLFLRADIDNPVARRFHDIKDELESAANVSGQSVTSRDRDAYDITFDNSFEQDKELIRAAKRGSKLDDSTDTSFARRWLQPLRTDIEKMKRPDQIRITPRLKEWSPFGYGEDELLAVSFPELARAVAKYDYAARIFAPHRYYIRGEAIGRLNKSSHLTQAERADAYDWALVESLEDLCAADKPAFSFWEYVRFMQGKTPSGVDWRRWRAPVPGKMPQGQERYLQLATDLNIDAASRLGWLATQGTVPIEHAAALHYRRADIGSAIDRRLHAKEYRGETIQAVVTRLLGEITPRSATHASVAYMGKGVDYYETDSHMFIRGEVGRRGFTPDESPVRLEANSANAQMIEQLGYTGLQGIDMLFAELCHDFARIDAFKL